ncbi:hypothetical protein A0J61_09017 [Choanephora cucurbitarum]|uniref:Uncharacterized protein n=1 Tax=Choanephora cucurbitarum TaxID=101091 RepID=A0A1C7N1G1_9FUNG|nr:hypothetical protein A0J61_09017 [Choanephora cucurbitarum]
MRLLNLALLLSISIVQAQTSARSNLSCGYLTGKVFCFFGFRYTGTTEHTLDNTINVLDLTNATGKTSANLEAAWKPVSSITNNVDIAPRQNPQATEMGDGRRMFFNGGFSPTSKLADQTIIYDAQKNEWSKYTPYTEEPYGVRQIYYGSALPVPGKGIALYGGFEVYINTSWTTPSTSVTSFNFPDNMTRTIGFTQVAFFNENNGDKAWTVPLSLTTWAPWFPNRQKSVFDSLNNQILFIGGEAFNNDPVAYKTVAERRPLSMAWAFSTQNASWSTFTLVGQVPSGTRLYHSLDLAPKTKKDVIMFGGETDGGRVADDYCYVLSLETREWKSVTINAPITTPLSRTEHSTVITNNETMLVVWGLDSNRAGLNSVLILNISDPYAITLSDKYFDPNSVTQTSTDSTSIGNTNNPKDDNHSPDGLSMGAIGGIAAACVVFAIVGAASYYVFYRKKHRKNQGHDSKPYSPDDQDIAPIEVDWDHLEGKYFEVSPESLVKQTAKASDLVSTTDMRSSDLQAPNATDPPLIKPDISDNVTLVHVSSSPTVMKPDIR